MQTFYFVPADVAPGAIYLTRPARQALGAGCPGQTVLCHGARRLEATLVPTGGDGCRLPVAPATAAALGLVEGIPYRLRWGRGELRLGPVIGIHVAERFQPRDLDPGNLIYSFLLRYPAVGGLVYLFATAGIDFANETITGYCWLPGEPDAAAAESPSWDWVRRYARRVRDTAAAEGAAPPPSPRTARFQRRAQQHLADHPLPPARGRWHGLAALGAGRLVEGRFPFPAAIWRRSLYLTPDQRRRLARRGVKLFNSHFFDKQEGHQMLAADPAVRPHLPVTEPLRDFAQLQRRLEQDGRAVLKPKEGTFGQGLIRVEQAAPGYTLRLRLAEEAETCATAADLAARLDRPIRGGQYLLQQCIDLPEHHGRLCDFRVVMQKDDRGHWHCTGIIGRFGECGSSTTNWMKRGYALPADEALCRIFGVGFRAAFGLKADLIAVAHAVCAALDRSGGCYGDLGLDMAIDRQRRIWLFEVNKRQYLDLAAYMGDEQTYMNVKSFPLLFAAHLAGFGRATVPGP